jgi:hypothetical protein
MECKGVDWICMAQSSVHCSVLVNTAMDMQITILAQNALTS